MFAKPVCLRMINYAIEKFHFQFNKQDYPKFIEKFEFAIRDQLLCETSVDEVSTPSKGVYLFFS